MSLIVKDLYFEFAGGKQILKGVDLTIQKGERIALVGDNGAGKSTLFSLLGKENTPDSGDILISDQGEVGILLQTPNLDPNMTVYQAVKAALGSLMQDLDRHTLLCAKSAEEYTDSLMAEISDLGERIEEKGGFAIEHTIDMTLSRLKIPHVNSLISELSGGERRRVDLARLLIAQPDIMLLDEPTNHLDTDSIRFVVDTLKQSNKIILFVSHDRDFIDAVASRIVELHQGVLYKHMPPFGNFLEKRYARMQIDQRTHARKKRIMEKEIEWLRAGVKARTTKQNARIGKAHALIDEVQQRGQAVAEKNVKMQKVKSRRLAKKILEIENLSIGFNGRVFFENFNLIMNGGERWGVIGPNGAGKTTFINTLMGHNKALKGSVEWGVKSQVAILDQHRDGLTDNLTLQQYFCPDGGDTVFLGKESMHIASYLEKYLFDPQDRVRQVKTLSGGEQNRLQLAKMMSTDANFIILDEPTNDLDVTMLGILEESLLEHQGVSLIISHDRTFLDRVCTGILAFEKDETSNCEHKLVSIQGNYTHYLRSVEIRAELEKKRRAETGIIDVKEEKTTTNTKTKDLNFKKKKRSYKENKEYETIEADVLAKEALLEEYNTKLADGSYFVSNPEDAAQMSVDLVSLEQDIAMMYERWQELEDMSG